mmetsp:Transcript_36803/g.91658  ORF Transcript_36803/g.91658 Transcript_36803/m.91658 type:complete len:227 (+) Transcript_36803:177-857(+)
MGRWPDRAPARGYFGRARTSAGAQRQPGRRVARPVIRAAPRARACQARCAGAAGPRRGRGGFGGVQPSIWRLCHPLGRGPVRARLQWPPVWALGRPARRRPGLISRRRRWAGRVGSWTIARDCTQRRRHHALLAPRRRARRARESRARAGCGYGARRPGCPVRALAGTRRKFRTERCNLARQVVHGTGRACGSGHARACRSLFLALWLAAARGAHTGTVGRRARRA